jgi:hypothetical protein
MGALDIVTVRTGPGSLTRIGDTVQKVSCLVVARLASGLVDGTSELHKDGFSVGGALWKG